MNKYQSNVCSRLFTEVHESIANSVYRIFHVRKGVIDICQELASRYNKSVLLDGKFNMSKNQGNKGNKIFHFKGFTQCY